MTSPEPPRHMSPDEFRAWGYKAIDWIADYHKSIEQFPVLSQVDPGDIRANLDAQPPESGQPFDEILADLDRVILPGITHWQSPSFFGYFPANASGPSILADLISSGLGVQGMLWATSPACSELETHVLDWLVDMLDLPSFFKSTSVAGGGGVIQDTASSATLCALLAARERATGWESNRTGSRQPLVAYASREAHSSIEKAARIAGIGDENLHLVDVDESHAMRADHLRELIERDRAAGLIPFFICATVGTTSSNAIDPVRAIGQVCRAQDIPIWLHVDAAMSGTAALCPEFRWIHDGLELADSYCFNPHKWMLTNFDCDCFYVRDRSDLIRTLSILPEYLRNEATESGAVIDYRDWQIPLGRRFRALKLWFVIRYYGIDGLQQHVRHGVSMAQQFRSWVERSDEFTLAAAAPLNLVCFRHRAGDAVTEQIHYALNASGRLFLTHTKLDGRYTLRIAIGGTATMQDHVTRAWEQIRRTALAIENEA